MKKSIKYIILLLLAIVVFEVGNYGFGMINIAAGYNAKTLCSCVFVSGRSEESVLDQDIAVSASSFIGGSVDQADQSATASFLGISRKAIYRPGVGCTLVSEIDEDVLRIQQIGLWPPDASLPDPDQPWPYGSGDSIIANPDAIDMAKIDEAFEYAFDEPDPDNPRYTRAALVVHKGQIIKEQYGEGFDEDTPLIGWSMTKSVTNAMVGLRVRDAALSLDDPANVPSWHTKSDDLRAKIRLRDLMDMTSGLDFVEDYSKPSTVNQMLWTKPSAAAVAEADQLAHPVNTHWYYSSGTTNIIQQIIRRSFDDLHQYQVYPYRELFAPLGMRSAIMELDASGTFVGSSLMYATARDWAKFGLLYLYDGVWNGQRILPEGWVDYSQERTPVLEDGFYGAQFWKNAYSEPGGSETPRHWPGVPQDAYYASGFEGQQVVIIPSLDMVVVRLGCTADRANWDPGKFLALIVESVQ
jgi:CubicO group peptidase (beta-lactamase class C family)